MNGVRAGLVAALLLTACTGPAAPVGTIDPGTPPATSAATPAITPPPVPQSVKTPKGAVDFVAYVWETYNYAYATNDPEPLRAISGPTCGFCAQVVADVEAVAKKGGRAEGYSVTVLTGSALPPEIVTGAYVVTIIDQEPGKIIAPSGTTSDSGWRKLKISSSVAWTSSGWIMEAVEADRTTGKRWPG